MKVYILCDEWYPVYDIVSSKHWGEAADLPETLVDRWKSLKKEFRQIQGEFQAALEAAEK